MSRSYVTWLVIHRDSCICDLTHETHSYMTWLIHMWHGPSIRRDTLIFYMIHSCVTWIIHTWHDAFIRDMTRSHLTWLIHIWHIWRDSLIRRDLLICDMTHMMHSYVTWLIHMWRFSFNRDMLIRHVTYGMGNVTYEWVVSHMDESWHTWTSHVTYECVMWVISHMIESRRMNVTRFIHSWHDSSYVTWLSHMWHVSALCDMSHLY